MAHTTAIANADWVVGYDGAGHRLIRGGTVAFSDNTITYVGTGYAGPADTVIDGRGRVVIPGLISTHAHLTTEARNKGFLEDAGSRKLWHSGLFEYMPAMGMAAFDQEAVVDVLRFSLVELVKSGCTAVFELGRPTEKTLVAMEESGLRIFTGPMYRSARWHTQNGHAVHYQWDEEAGRHGLREAVDFVERHSSAWGGRLTGVLCPAQADTCTPELLRETMAAARRLDTRVQIHAAQSVSEHLEMMRRHGMTPIEFLARQGMVGPQVIIGHALLLAHHSAIRYPDHDDLGVLAQTGTHVAHCPWVFGRRGVHMESFGGYLRRGVNVTIGTDTCPQDMMEEMRWAAVLSKNATNDAACPTAAETFTAATLNAARALGREDLGRLAPGAKADVVILDGRAMTIRPLRDPVKSIVYYGASRSVETVIVDGRVLVRGGQVLDVDEYVLAERLQGVAERTLAGVKERDWAGRTHEQLSPLSFPLWEGPPS
ncbi:MAG: amidohydrolase family protein [Armatimonadetes bacterium]|nr:amidohydrolase family protein [Armatimonadota bacterium]